MAERQGAPLVVVVTGASAGIGRASARLVRPDMGARVALLARGEIGLEGARKEIEHAGGDGNRHSNRHGRFRAGRAGRRGDRKPARRHRRLGERRVRLGLCAVQGRQPERVPPRHGGELSRVRARDDGGARSDEATQTSGTIVQVGSALGARAIPLQSAYCGAKHAINGFTESLRCELLHDKSNVRITVVQMPAVNTPQFSWVLSRLPRHPQPVPPIYQPEVAARAVVYAAAHPQRKQYWVGASTVATLVAQKLMPAVLDRYLARTGFDFPADRRRPA